MQTAGRSFPRALLIGTAFFGVLLVATSAAQPVRGGPIKLEGLSRQEFEKLPPDQPLTLQGRSLTKSQFLAEFQQKQSQSFLRRGETFDLASRLKQFEDKEKARIQAGNASRFQAHQSMHKVGAGAVAVHCLGPKIEGFEVDVVEPGMHYLTIKGCGFGCAKGTPCSGVEGPGEVRLHGNFPGGSVHLPLSPYQWWAVWYDGRIDVNMPPGLNSLVDHTVQLQVIRKDGKQSNLWPLKFKAAMETRLLKLSDFQVSCSNAATSNTCGPGKTAEGEPDPAKTATVYHEDIVLSAGKDTFSLPSLKNGWHFQNYTFEDSSTPSTSVTPPEFTPSANTVSANLNYFWTIYFNGKIRYNLAFWIVGPEGFDYK
ncbi:MAG TPA: hypothetical protein VGK70_00215 [Thermoanaerobaculia bacterium]|jgi:hypothetical protein